MEATRAALVVAAHEFVDPKFQRLRSPAQDVDALADVLGDDTIGGFEVQTILNESSFVVQQQLERFFSDRKPDDLLLLYFSCHGVKDPSGRLYFVTSNTTFDLLRSTGISAAFVSEQMEYSRSKRIVVLLDCCYSGAFLKGFRARGDDTVAVDQLEGRGRAVMTASRATEYAFEADQLATENARPSMFTGAIVEGLATGKADRNGDGLVTIDELYDYVYDAVRGKVTGQTPGRWTDVEGDLIIARNPRPEVRPAALPPELQRAVESDAALQRLGAVSELAQWLGGDDPSRRLAAGPVLQLLSRDYDERVKAAASAALAGADTVTAPASEPLLAPADPIESAARLEAPAPAVPSPAVPSPAGPVAGDGGGGGKTARLAGWLAAVGGFGVLISPHVAYLRFDGYSSSLKDRKWWDLGALVIFGLAAYGASGLVRKAKPQVAALMALAALVPVAAATGLITLGDLVHGDGVVGPRAGWVLLLAGLLLLVVAGVIAAGRARRLASLAPAARAGPEQVRATGGTIAALCIGAAATLGWAKVFSVTGDGLFGVAGQVQSLAFRLLGLGAVFGVGRRWLPVSGRRGVAALSGCGVLVVALFLSDVWVTDAGLFLAGLAAMAVGAALVPVLSTVLVPRRHGFVLLAAWAAASAAWVPSWTAQTGTSAALLLTVLAAAGALAAVLARLPDDRGAGAVHRVPVAGAPETT